MLVAYQILTAASDIIYDPFMMALLIGTGIFLTFRLRGIQARKLVYTIRLMLERKEEGRGDISPFRALMTTLSGTLRHRQYRRCRNRNLTGRSWSDLLDVADRYCGDGDKVR